jgi:hypothetical protein
MKNQQAYRYRMGDGRECGLQQNGDCPPEPELPRAIDLFWHAAPWLVAGTLLVLLIVLGLRVILAPLSP